MDAVDEERGRGTCHLHVSSSLVVIQVIISPLCMLLAAGDRLTALFVPAAVNALLARPVLASHYHAPAPLIRAKSYECYE